MSRILIIQTAFIGDVVLATPIIESLALSFPDAKIDFLLRKGNENLLEGHPKINKLIIWNKKQNKYRSLFRLLLRVRKEHYNYVVNIQRFASTGLFTAFSRGKVKVGFKKNPFSIFFNVKIGHRFEKSIHEIDRNLELIESFAKNRSRSLKLHPSPSDYERVRSVEKTEYVCLAPASVWFTKQLPEIKWVELCKLLDNKYKIFFLGAPSDEEMCKRIIDKAEITNYMNYCGKLTFLQSAALMEKAKMNYVNDSAPLHFASAMNAKTTAFFCSTIPQFGFGPLADGARIAEINFDLSCRPCGLHGKSKCPQSHFNCGNQIEISKFLP